MATIYITSDRPTLSEVARAFEPWLTNVTHAELIEAANNDVTITENRVLRRAVPTLYFRIRDQRGLSSR